MPSGRPNWKAPLFRRADPDCRLSEQAEAAVNSLAGNLSPDQRLALLKGCADAKSDFFSQKNRIEHSPTEAEKKATAEYLEAACRDLADKLFQAGGISDDLSRVAEQRGLNALSTFELMNQLNAFADICDEAAIRPALRKNAGIRLKKPRVAAASVLAFEFSRCFEKEPSCYRKTEFSDASPYLKLVKIVIDDCTGKNAPLTAVENFAREGLADYRAGRTFRYTSCPDIHE